MIEEEVSRAIDKLQTRWSALNGRLVELDEKRRKLSEEMADLGREAIRLRWGIEPGVVVERRGKRYVVQGVVPKEGAGGAPKWSAVGSTWTSMRLGLAKIKVSGDVSGIVRWMPFYPNAEEHSVLGPWKGGE